MNDKSNPPDNKMHQSINVYHSYQNDRMQGNMKRQPGDGIVMVILQIIKCDNMNYLSHKMSSIGIDFWAQSF